MSINPKFVVTGKARLSFVHVFQPYSYNPGQEEKFSTTILIPKSDVATKQRIDAAVNAAVQEGISKNWNGVRPPVLAIPVYDGDGVRPSDGMPFGEECKGHWVFTASSKQAPQVVDLGLNPVINQSEIYSGVYARVSVNFFAYNSNGKKGVGCGLGNIQKLEDGEPLGGRTTAASDFGDSAPQQFGQPVYAPQQPYALQQPVQYNVPQQQNVPLQQQYAQPQQQYAPVQQPIQYDPITGAPITGGVMGI